MENYKKNIKLVSFLFFTLFGLVIFNLIKFIFFESSQIITNPYNRRLTVMDESLKRGDILDRNGNLLVTSTFNDTSYDREYLYPKQFAHTIGYMGSTRAGIEAKYNFNLQNLDNEVFQRIYNLVYNIPLRGDNLSLTLDLNLQKLAYEQLGNRNGAIVVMEPSTGKILSMVSYPNYDPSSISDDWETLKNDSTNSPLINRAAQGLYPPGSIYKLIPAIAALENGQEDLEFDCEGFIEVDGARIRCYDSIAHGHLSLLDAVAFSCNTSFALLGDTLGTAILQEVSERFLFNQTLSYPLEYSVSSFQLNHESNKDELLQTSIGQGKTLVTPLHMAMIVSGIANNGVIMKPYLVDHSINFNGDIKDKILPEMLAQITSAENTEKLTDMMVSVVEKGTARGTKIEGLEIAAKTGTAQNSSDEEHGWLVAFAPAKNPQIAVAIVLENSGGSVPCQPIAKEIFKFMLNSSVNF